MSSCPASLQVAQLTGGRRDATQRCFLARGALLHKTKSRNCLLVQADVMSEYALLPSYSRSSMRLCITREIITQINTD